MKRGKLLMLGALGLGAAALYVYRAKLAALFNPDPGVSGIARSMYGASQDVPGTIAGVTGAASRSPVASALSIVQDVLGGAGSSGAGSYQGSEVAGAAPPAPPQMLPSMGFDLSGTDTFEA